MGRIVGLVCLVFLLGACQTTGKTSGKKPRLYSNPQSLGWAVGYSEICSLHRGLSVDNHILAHFKKIHGDDHAFDSGYRRNASLAGSDFVTGLTNCDHVNESLEYSYKRFTNWVAEPSKADRVVSADRKSHVLTLEWEENDERVAYETYVTSSTSKHFISDYFEMETGEFCKFEWILRSDIKGDWKFSCDNGKTGKGIFGANAVTKIYSGYGKVYLSTTPLSKLDFTLVPLSEKS